MNGREEFDWGRMRREEDEYFAAKQAEPKTIGDVAARAGRKIAGGIFRTDDEVAALMLLKSMPYDEYLRTDHWREVRHKTLVRDGHECRICASRKRLQVHHLTYDRRGEEQARDVVTLCRRCHELQHS